MIPPLLRPGLGVGTLVAPAVVFIAASIGLERALRGRRWPRPDTEDRRIGRDEWVQANFNRSRRIALLAIFTVQVPLIFVVAYVPASPTVSTSVVGMALLTMSSGSVALFASYLLFSRQHANG